MKKHTEKARKRTHMGRLGRRVSALACALALSMTLLTAAFAEEPFGDMEQPQTVTADGPETEQPTADAVSSEQLPESAAEPEPEAAETAQPELPPENEEQAAGPELALDEANFPDPAFLESLRRYDLNGDGSLSRSEREAVTEIDVRGQGIRSLEGIGAFPNLTRLNCIGNALSELPLDQMPKLTSLLCNENELTRMDLSMVPMLRVLHCHDNRLRELDVSANPQLYEIACGDNQFTSLDVSHNPQLVYLLYLGGPLETLTLGGNDALRELWCSYTLVSQLDLAQAPNLEMLGIEYSEIRYLDIEANRALTHVLASGCRLLGAKLPAGISADLSHQRAVEVQVGAQETSFDLMRLGLPLDMANISQMTGAELQGSVLTGISDNTMVTYRYQTDGDPLTALILFRVSNAWVEPLSLEDWTYGEQPPAPHAQAEYGNVVYTYSDSPNGPFGPEAPSQAGTWYVKASVEETPEHAGLTDVKEFHILKAHPIFTMPSGLTAIYTSTLDSVDPGTGFEWENPRQNVGSVGERSFLAKYLPADLNNYEIEYHLPVTVKVLPKPAQEEWVPQLTGPQDVASLQICDGQTTLQKGLDYEVTTYTENGRVTVLVTFQGNYTGQIRRGYVQEPSVPVPPPVPTGKPETTPPPVATGKPEATPPVATSKPEATPPQQEDPAGGGEEHTPPEKTPSAPAASKPDRPESGTDETESEAPEKESGARYGMILLWILLLCLFVAIWLYERNKKRNDKNADSDLYD